MDINEANKHHWQTYPAGTTPGIDEMPSPELLDSLPKTARILDVGTGTGHLADSLAERGYAVFGIDLNPQEIAADDARGTTVAYSVQDIIAGTDFPEHSFDLVMFRYTLTNIHWSGWEQLGREVGRLLKDSGYLWLAEPLVNDAYATRYTLAEQVLDEPHTVFVFSDPGKAKEIVNADQLQQAEKDGAVSRIIRHYTEAEIAELFPGYQVLTQEHTEHVSPSGYSLSTLVMTLQK
jgi:SAM-dependent methyltransferase